MDNIDPLLSDRDIIIIEMIQKALVLLAVAVTSFFAVRGVVRTLKGKRGCSCQDCPLSHGKECHCHADIPDIRLGDEQ